MIFFGIDCCQFKWNTNNFSNNLSYGNFRTEFEKTEIEKLLPNSPITFCTLFEQINQQVETKNGEYYLNIYLSELKMVLLAEIKLAGEIKLIGKPHLSYDSKKYYLSLYFNKTKPVLWENIEEKYEKENSEKLTLEKIWNLSTQENKNEKKKLS